MNEPTDEEMDRFGDVICKSVTIGQHHRAYDEYGRGAWIHTFDISNKHRSFVTPVYVPLGELYKHCKSNEILKKANEFSTGKDVAVVVAIAEYDGPVDKWCVKSYNIPQ